MIYTVFYRNDVDFNYGYYVCCRRCQLNGNGAVSDQSLGSSREPAMLSIAAFAKAEVSPVLYKVILLAASYDT